MSRCSGGSDYHARVVKLNLLLLCVWIAPVAAQTSRPSLPRVETAHFELTFAPGEIAGCREREPRKQMDLYATRLEELHARCAEVLGTLDHPRFAVAIVRDAEEFQRLVAASTDLEVQGIGARSRARGACVLLHAPKRDDAMLHRLVVHQVAHLLLANSEIAESWGWFEEGLAHWFEADRGAGICENLCYLERAQPARSFWNGRWRSAVRELLERDRLPALDELFGRDVVDMNLEQRATAFAFVDWLTRTAAPPITHTQSKPTPPLVQLLRAAKAGEPADAALRRCLGADRATLEARFRAWIKSECPRA